MKSGAADEDGEEDGVKVVDLKTTIKLGVDENYIGGDFWGKAAVFQDLIDITLRRMDHDRDGRISFSDFSTTVQVYWKIVLIDFHLDCIILPLSPQGLSIETALPIQDAFQCFAVFQEEPLLMEAFGPCLPNNRAGGEFIRLQNKSMQCFTLNQKCFLMFYPLVRKVLDGKPDGVGYYD